LAAVYYYIGIIAHKPFVYVLHFDKTKDLALF